MAIEGPLRELGIHDVFQLLDLSRKTGVLRVSSELREDEGVVYFDAGRVVQASIRSKRAPALDADAISRRELERLLRLQLESVVFELMSWQEGFFSFEELPRDQLPRDSRIAVSTESLLMEGARRIDEWSRIADVVPSADVVPQFAPVEGEQGGTMLDLLPHEWQVLTMIDGERDLRDIAASLGRDEFEVAKIAYGLVTTGVVEVQRAATRTPTNGAVPAAAPSADTARAVAQELAAARTAIEHLLRLAPDGRAAPEARDALEALARLQRVLGDRLDG
ncbi:MAG: DUF4388 domain-containing protein [Acidobacteriota bacterium]